MENDLFESPLKKQPETNLPTPERALLLGHEELSVAELGELARTAGAEVAATLLQQNTDRFGSGKLKEAADLAKAINADLVIYDNELTGARQREWEDQLGVRLIDRTALILDIFAARARSREGQLQVELAQCTYALTRLAGQGTELSRLGGGIGTRGPGEKKLETDRRHLRHREQELKHKLEELRAQRQLKRQKREEAGLFRVALVGYTNAGKSTLLGALSGAEVFAEDKLFATLDPLTRAVEWEDIPFLLTDTVGFVSRLPHALVDAFRSTLEETVFSDVLLHVCDCSNPQVFMQMEVVEQVLSEMGAGSIPVVLVANKADALAVPPPIPGALYISARTGMGLDALRQRLLEIVRRRRSRSKLVIPYNRPELLAAVHAAGQVHEETYCKEGTEVDFTASPADTARIRSRLGRAEER